MRPVVRLLVCVCVYVVCVYVCVCVRARVCALSVINGEFCVLR